MSFTDQNASTPDLQLKNQKQAPEPGSSTLPCIYFGPKLRNHQSTSSVSGEVSADDEPFLIGPQRARRTRCSLSSIGNRLLRSTSCLLESSFKSKDDAARGNLAWDVNANDIFEWQNVCQTGRPSWRSPVPETAEREIHSTGQEGIQMIHPWSSNEHLSYCSKKRYGEGRRAVTDSYLAAGDSVQDMVHIIAVQLLGACFTLPPERMSNYKSSAYYCFDTLESGDMPESRLISSLRMHAESRYSPSFGFQARNTSPISHVHGAYDGASRTSSFDEPSTDIENPDMLSQRRKAHEALDGSGCSASDCAMDGLVGHCDTSNVEPNSRTTTWKQRKHIHQPERCLGSPKCPDRVLTCPEPSGRMDRLLRNSIIASRNCRGHTIDVLPNYHDTHGSRRPNRFSLHSVIRFEPHNVYIVPVKDLVVKRWQTFRRRFGRSLSHGSPNPKRTADLTVSTSTSSTISVSLMPVENQIPDGPRFSSDGKDRRLQARERGNIYSTSIESDPRYNTSTSAAGSGAASPKYIEQLSPKSELPDPLYVSGTPPIDIPAAAASRSPGMGVSSAPVYFTQPNSFEATLNPPEPQPAPRGSPRPRGGTEPSTSPPAGNPRPVNLAPSYSPRRKANRHKRKSMLSEVCTPDDYGEDTCILREATGPLKSTEEHFQSEVKDEWQCHSPKEDIRIEEDAEEKGICTAQTHKPRSEPLVLPPPEVIRGITHRPRIVRSSTSGTSVFTPSEDGIEIDGLPAGPSAQTWYGQAETTRRRESTFLL